MEKEEKNVAIFKEMLPGSFWIAFYLMVLFAILYVVAFVISYNVNTQNERLALVLQFLPFIFIILAVIFSIKVAVTIVVIYMREYRKG